MSLEEVLRRVGLQRGRLPAKHTEARIHQWIEESRQMHPRREGLAL